MKVDLEQIARSRRAEGHSQRWLSEQMGITNQSYSRKERGLQKFRKLEVEFLERLYNKKFKLEE